MITPLRAITDDPREFWIYMDNTYGDDNNNGEYNYPVKTLTRAIWLASQYGKNVYIRYSDSVYDIGEDRCRSWPWASTIFISFNGYNTNDYSKKFLGQNPNGSVTTNFMQIVGESSKKFNFSGYTASGTLDTSGSYSIITFSPSPNWETDRWEGHYFQSSSIKGMIISNTDNTLTVIGAAGGSISGLDGIYKFPEIEFKSGFSYSIFLSCIFCNIRFYTKVSSLYIGDPNQPICFNNCYFYSDPALGGASLYPSGYTELYNCVANRVRIGSTSNFMDRGISCQYVAVKNLPSYTGFFDVTSCQYCSAWNCGNFFQTVFNFNSSGRTYFIKGVGGNVLNKFISLYSGSNNQLPTRIIIRDFTTYGNGITLNNKQIQVNDKTISIDYYPYNTMGRYRTYLLFRDDNGLEIFKGDS